MRKKLVWQQPASRDGLFVPLLGGPIAPAYSQLSCGIKNCYWNLWVFCIQPQIVAFGLGIGAHAWYQGIWYNRSKITETCCTLYTNFCILSTVTLTVIFVTMAHVLYRCVNGSIGNCQILRVLWTTGTYLAHLIKRRHSSQYCQYWYCIVDWEGILEVNFHQPQL